MTTTQTQTNATTAQTTRPARDGYMCPSCRVRGGHAADCSQPDLVTPDAPGYYDLADRAPLYARSGSAAQAGVRTARILCPSCYGRCSSGIGRTCPQCSGFGAVTVTLPVQEEVRS